MSCQNESTVPDGNLEQNPRVSKMQGGDPHYSEML